MDVKEVLLLWPTTSWIIEHTAAELTRNILANKLHNLILRGFAKKAPTLMDNLWLTYGANIKLLSKQSDTK